MKYCEWGKRQARKKRRKKAFAFLSLMVFAAAFYFGYQWEVKMYQKASVAPSGSLSICKPWDMDCLNK